MGMRPVAEMQFADFISCTFDQLVNFAATNHYRWGEPVPIVVRAPSGGGLRAGPFHSRRPGSSTHLASRWSPRPRLTMQRGCSKLPSGTITR
jgi:pyruvate/2-oxoglutarate/acetoin dehydrogenase E1 component